MLGVHVLKPGLVVVVQSVQIYVLILDIGGLFRQLLKGGQVFLDLGSVNLVPVELVLGWGSEYGSHLAFFLAHVSGWRVLPKTHVSKISVTNTCC